jgi:hypothetical protein
MSFDFYTAVLPDGSKPSFVDFSDFKDTSNFEIFSPPASKTGGTPDCTKVQSYTIFNNHGSMLRLQSDFEQLLTGLEVLRRIEAPENAAFIDTVSLTFKSKAYYQAFPDSPAITTSGTDIVADISLRLCEIFGFGITSKRSSGINNYTYSYVLGNDWGHLAIGGRFQRDSIQIYLNGQGCL